MHAKANREVCLAQMFMGVSSSNHLDQPLSLGVYRTEDAIIRGGM